MPSMPRALDSIASIGWLGCIDDIEGGATLVIDAGRRHAPCKQQMALEVLEAVHAEELYEYRSRCR